MNKPSPTMPLRKYFLEIYVPDRVNLRRPTIGQFETTLRIYDRFVGKPASLDDLDEEKLNRFKAAYSAGAIPGQSGPPAAATIKSKLRDLCAIWSTAWDKHHTRKAPRKIKRPREDRRQPQAYSIDEMRRILEQAGRLSGTIAYGDPFQPVPRNLWWTALILTCYSTAARIGALLAATVADFDGRRIYLRAENQKQHADQTVWPNAEALAAIDTIRNPLHSHLFWWPYSRRYLFRFHRRHILDPAGIVSSRRGMDQFQKYRRTGLSFVAAQSEDQAVKMAGHSSPAITRKNYLDPDIVYSAGPSASVPALAADPDDDPDDGMILSMADYA